MSNDDQKFRAIADAFIAAILDGYTERQAAILAGAPIEQAMEVVKRLRDDSYVIRTLHEARKKARVSKVWGAGKAVMALHDLIQDPAVRDAVKLQAIDRLNVIAGITIVDENGNTKRAEEMAGLLARLDAELDAQEATKSARQQVTRH
ncbi:TPA: hypothetical protein U2T46_002983 [Burkholderia cenocepacia]|nr:hypothetical protein [Burkholderia cenocepacia]